MSYLVSSKDAATLGKISRGLAPYRRAKLAELMEKYNEACCDCPWVGEFAKLIDPDVDVKDP